MTRKPFSLAWVIALCAPLALVTSCGTNEAVPGTIIEFQPTGWSVPTDPLDPLTCGVLYYQVAAKSPSGAAQVGISLHITNPNNLNIYKGHQTQIAAACGATVAGTPEVTPFDDTTDVTGTIRLTVVFFYSGGNNTTIVAVDAYSGASYGKGDLIFTCSDSNTADALECP